MAEATGTTGDRPTNVVWLGADHYAYRHHVSVPGPAPATPAYDRLVDEGVRFDRAYCATPLCVPSRTSMMTGTYPHVHGFLRNAGHPERDGLPYGDEEEYYGDAFVESGRRAAYFGKWHVGHGTTAQEYGFDGWSQPAYGWPYRSDRYADHLRRRGLSEPTVELDWHRTHDVEALNPLRPANRDNMFDDPALGGSTGVFETPKETHEAFFTTHLANRWIEERARNGEPFFVRVETWGPHQPHWVPPEFADTIDPRAIPEYPNFDADLSDRPAHHRTFLDGTETSDYAWEEWQPIVARCYEHVTAVDHAFETVLDTLDRLGLADDTLVLYSADHGDIIAAHGGGFDKGWLLVEETTRIPLVVRWPNGDVPAGEACDALVCNVDYPPTMYEAAGRDPPSRMDGTSLLDLARDPERATDWRDRLLIEHHGHYGEWVFQRALYRDRYKYVAHLDDGDELYDLEADPYERRNRIADPALADVRDRMRSALLEEMRVRGDDAPDAVRLRRSLGEPADASDGDRD